MGDKLQHQKWSRWIWVLVIIILIGIGGFYGHKVYRESHPKLLTDTQIKSNLGIHLSNKLISEQDNLEKNYSQA